MFLFWFSFYQDVTCFQKNKYSKSLDKLITDYAFSSFIIYLRARSKITKEIQHTSFPNRQSFLAIKTRYLLPCILFQPKKSSLPVFLVHFSRHKSSIIFPMYNFFTIRASYRFPFTLFSPKKLATVFAKQHASFSPLRCSCHNM